MSLMLLALALPLTSLACEPLAPADFVTYTARVIHHKNNPASVAAKEIVKKQFCDKFNIVPCETSAAGLTSLQLVGDLAIQIPRSRFAEVVPWLMQQRLAQVSGSGYDLDLKLSPNSGCSGLDENQYSLFIGHDYRINPSQLKGADTAVGSSPSQKDFAGNDWAYSCSDDCKRSDEWNVCVGTPANNTQCNSVSQGFHLHLYFTNNDPSSEAARAKFHDEIAAEFGVSETVCPDDYGHEQPHDRSCFLTGPGGRESDYPQASARSSFATGTHSFYICSEEKCPGDFTNIVSWLMVYKNEDKIGRDLTFLLHPTFGCNFADHQNWGFRARLPALGASTHVENNLYGIQSSADFTGKSAPSVDPNSVSWPHKQESGCGESSDVQTFSVHIVYNPDDVDAVSAKESFLQSIVSKLDDLLKADQMCLGEDDQQAYLKEESPFLAGHVKIGVRRLHLGPLLSLVLTSRPASVDISITSDGACPFASYMKQSLWAGAQTTFNEHAFYVGDMQRFAGSCFTSQSPSSSVVKDSDAFVLMVQHAPDNSWAATAKETFLNDFASDFGVSRKSCAKSEFVLEPSFADICMMEENSKPYSDTKDPNTAAYGRIFVPGSKIADVAAWVMIHQSAQVSGYALDTQFIPLTGSPLRDYQENSLRGNHFWSLKQDLLSASTDILI